MPLEASKIIKTKQRKVTSKCHYREIIVDCGQLYHHVSCTLVLPHSGTI